MRPHSRWTVWFVVVMLLAVACGSTHANSLHWQDALTGVSGYQCSTSLTWNHAAYPYDVTNITSATLTVDAFDVDSQEDDELFFEQVSQGYLNHTASNTNGTTVFNIAPGLIDGTGLNTVFLDIEAGWCVTINNSTLDVYASQPSEDDSPEPATWALLACTGAFGAIARRRRKK